ncbi:hypothetical protein NDU88_002703 [Pleurodeles waltl]|uniref:Uncharacterized protein n=1 Tax=Pleurodeles waltl TaxID=8319 RepID=A0AAV7UWC7_PLEWA|nr:hypothetical protein NDU88_002703 [Pleurodeles waltl]
MEGEPLTETDGDLGPTDSCSSPIRDDSELLWRPLETTMDHDCDERLSNRELMQGDTDVLGDSGTTGGDR